MLFVNMNTSSISLNRYEYGSGFSYIQDCEFTFTHPNVIGNFLKDSLYKMLSLRMRLLEITIVLIKQRGFFKMALVSSLLLCVHHQTVGPYVTMKDIGYCLDYHGVCQIYAHNCLTFLLQCRGQIHQF